MTALTLAVVAWLLGIQASSDLPNLVVPPDDNAWVIRIVTTGGFTGQGAGNVTANSAGQMLCTLMASCPDRLVPETKRSLSQLVTRLRLVDATDTWAPPTAGVCADCVTTIMTVRRRDSAGEHSARYTWDVSSVRAIPDDVLRLHAAIVGLTAPRSR